MTTRQARRVGWRGGRVTGICIAEKRSIFLITLFTFLVLPRGINAQPASAPKAPLIAILNAYPPEMESKIKAFNLPGPGFTSEVVSGFSVYRRGKTRNRLNIKSVPEFLRQPRPLAA
jgi:hypothetical protein